MKILKVILNMLCRFNLFSKVCLDVQESIRKYEWSERKKVFGKLYSDKIFYVIRVRPMTSSIGPLVLWTCKQLKICDLNGYIPVIDFSFFENVFIEKDETGGKVNPWEYYFEQPTMYSTQAVYHAKNVILGNADADCTLEDVDNIFDNDKIFIEYCELFEKYIHINKRIEKKAENIYNQIIRPEWKVLGCVYRGTEYRNNKVIGEHRQPSIEDEIKKAQELMDKWNCDHIFLATEDKGGLEKFRKVFNDKLVYVERKRYPSNVAHTEKFRLNRKQDAYYKGEAYLIEIYVLSRCNCLLSARVGILLAALPMNNRKYEHKYIYDLGIYTESDYDKANRKK